MNEDEEVMFAVEFEVRDRVTYRVMATNEDEAVEKAMKDAELDYSGDADYIQSWEI